MACVSYTALLRMTKKNLILEHDQDDKLITGFLKAAVDYAERYQHKEDGFYKTEPMPPSTIQAVVMLASHFYESRDGSTAGFFGDTPNAADRVNDAVERLLRQNKDVLV